MNACIHLKIIAILIVSTCKSGFEPFRDCVYCCNTPNDLGVISLMWRLPNEFMSCFSIKCRINHSVVVLSRIYGVNEIQKAAGS